MKKEQFDIATQDMHNRVKELVLNQLPTLDGIMQADKMSPEDRVFYEAYKKFGNRNHTWQEFKAMFNGDIATMQATINHWKTWDKINTATSQAYDLAVEIRTLIKKYDIKTIDVTKPEEFKQHPDLVAVCEEYHKAYNSAHQNYSTFNPQVAKLEQEFEKKAKVIAADDNKAKIDLVVEYLQKMDEYIDLQNGNFVVAERIEMYREIILHNPQIFELIKDFDTLSSSQRFDLAYMILDKSAKISGTPTGKVILDDAPDGPHILKEKQSAAYANKKKEFLFRDDVLKQSSLFGFLEVLAHEDAHRIDYYNAEYGMIGTQLMKFVEDNYLDSAIIDVELYRKFATEQSSYYMDKTIAAVVSYDIKQTAKDR